MQAKDLPGSDIDLMRDVYMTRTQRAAYERILAIAEAAEDLRADAFEAGWRCAANWCERDDLIADIGSGAYQRDRAAALSTVAPVREG